MSENVHAHRKHNRNLDSGKIQKKKNQNKPKRAQKRHRNRARKFTIIPKRQSKFRARFRTIGVVRIRKARGVVRVSRGGPRSTGGPAPTPSPCAPWRSAPRPPNRGWRTLRRRFQFRALDVMRCAVFVGIRRRALDFRVVLI